MNYQCTNVKCPFFFASGRNTMMCEGMIGETKTTMTFNHSEHKQEWFDKVCCDNWGLCPVAQKVKEKYDA